MTSLRLFIFLFLALPLLWQQALASEPVFPKPFGLSWGATSKELSDIGFTKLDSGDDMVAMHSYATPKSWSIGKEYVVFLYNDKMVRAGAFSEPFKNDVYGTEGKEAFERIVGLIGKKYGPMKKTTFTGLKLYKDSDEFYQCLEYAGCGYYQASLDYAGGQIHVRLIGERRGEGKLMVSYDSPELNAANSAIDAKGMENDDDAF